MIVVLVVMSLLPLGTALADPSFVQDGFKTKWSRADKPVNDGNSNPARSWLWGPEGFNPASGTTEPYGDSPGGVRTVEYFDKARMELNNPTTGLVTNGLLVRELISGKLATSDAGSTQRRAADDIPVAGDPSGNNGPTYFSFQKIATLNNDNSSPDRTGQAVSDTIGKDGALGTNPALGGNIKYVYYDATLKHNIPDVFWTFMNQRGNISVNGALQDNQPILGDNPVAPWLDAMGFPIADAYWSQVTVAGQTKDVLIQPFERRVVTYTPSNPAAFQVEMGNVGRHYYTWRYTASYDIPPVAVEVANDCAKNSPPDPKNGVVHPTKCVQPGVYMFMDFNGFNPNEQIGFWLNSPAGSIVGTKQTYNVGPTGSVKGLPWDTKSVQTFGVWSWVFQGTSPARQAVIYIYVAENVGVKFQSVQGAGLGATASATVQTSANTTCSITYWDPAGNRSHASGLESKKADGTGKITWSWTIGTNTQAGKGDLEVTCNGGTAYSPITVG